MQVNQKHLSIILLAAAAFLSSGAVPDSAPILDLVSGLEAFEGDCWLCLYSEGPPEVHRWPENGGSLCDTEKERQANNCEEIPDGEELDEWIEGECPDEGCAPSEEDSQLTQALVNEDSPRIASLIQLHPDRYELNLARNAVQIVGCGDYIVGHVPLTVDQVDEIQAAMGMS